MTINVMMTNLSLILLVLTALCALFPTNAEATNSLSEEFGKCEKKFWYKNLSHYKQSLKSKCLKEEHHKNHNEKRHRQHHVCHNDDHHDKKSILSKWQNFSECRCDSALKELKDFKNSKVFLCYQIAKFNKSTGKFVGQLSVYKKKSDKNYYDVAIKFNHIKLLNYKKGQWSKYKKDYLLSKSKKGSKEDRSENDQFLIENHIIHGKISKSESMDKVSLNRISPTDFLIIDDKHDKTRSLEKNNQVALIPFSKFIPNEDLKSGDNNDNSGNSGNDEKKQGNTPNSSGQDSNPPSNPAKPGDSTNPSPDSTPAPGSTPGSDTYTSNSDSVANQSNESQSKPTAPVSSSNQEDNKDNNKGNQNGSGYSFAGLGVVGAIISVGAAFVGYNTYERLKWRRHYRRGQAASTSQQNSSLANVPDYNGFGRAY